MAIILAYHWLRFRRWLCVNALWSCCWLVPSSALAEWSTVTDRAILQNIETSTYYNYYLADLYYLSYINSEQFNQTTHLQNIHNEIINTAASLNNSETIQAQARDYLATIDTNAAYLPQIAGDVYQIASYSYYLSELSRLVNIESETFSHTYYLQNIENHTSTAASLLSTMSANDAENKELLQALVDGLVGDPDDGEPTARQELSIMRQQGIALAVGISQLQAAVEMSGEDSNTHLENIASELSLLRTDVSVDHVEQMERLQLILNELQAATGFLLESKISLASIDTTMTNIEAIMQGQDAKLDAMRGLLEELRDGQADTNTKLDQAVSAIQANGDKLQEIIDLLEAANSGGGEACPMSAAPDRMRDALADSSTNSAYFFEPRQSYGSTSTTQTTDIQQGVASCICFIAGAMAEMISDPDAGSSGGAGGVDTNVPDTLVRDVPTSGVVPPQLPELPVWEAEKPTRDAQTWAWDVQTQTTGPPAWAITVDMTPMAAAATPWTFSIDWTFYATYARPHVFLILPLLATIAAAERVYEETRRYG